MVWIEHRTLSAAPQMAWRMSNPAFWSLKEDRWAIPSGPEKACLQRHFLSEQKTQNQKGEDQVQCGRQRLPSRARPPPKEGSADCVEFGGGSLIAHQELCGARLTWPDYGAYLRWLHFGLQILTGKSFCAHSRLKLEFLHCFLHAVLALRLISLLCIGLLLMLRRWELRTWSCCLDSFLRW